jgi:type VI protein secretion system component Hcp
MAEYGIVIGIKDIKGNCALADYKDFILAEAASFASSSTRMGKGITNTRISVDQSPVSVQMLAGKWIAELQNACYISKNIGEVKIHQLGQAVDKESQAKPTVIQSLTLTDAVVVSVEQGWSVDDGSRIVGVTFNFAKILLEIGKKPADFTLRNFTAKAV